MLHRLLIYLKVTFCIKWKILLLKDLIKMVNVVKECIVNLQILNSPKFRK